MKVVVLILVYSFVNFLNCEIFSAIDELEKLVTNHKFACEEIKVFAAEVNDIYINRKLKLWQNEQKLIDQDVSSYITNPLNAFLMIKRLISEIKLIEKRFPQKSAEFLKNVSKFQPGDEDLVGAVEGLLRLQRIYRLLSVDFANGIIDGKKTRSELTTHDLYIFGEEASNLNDQEFFAKEYLTMAWNKMKQGHDRDTEVDETSLLLKLVLIHNKTGDYDNAISIIDELIKKNPNKTDYTEMKLGILGEQKKHGTSKILEQKDPYSDFYEKNGKYSRHKENILYSQVCRGNITKSPKELSKLRCQYVSNNAFTKLGPFKVEEANLDPYIVLFHDVMTSSEIEYLKNTTKQNLQRAETFKGDLTRKKSSSRVAKLGWHNDNSHKIIKRISERIEDMTGLSTNMNTAEGLQSQNYGIGGHYVPHWDHRSSNDSPCDDKMGNRISTVLFYMTDVEKGGFTIFPYLKVRIPARKGTAAFWYNLRTSGQGDYFTRHAGCPVLLGNKWVANKWIREYGQIFRRPCIPENFVDTVETIIYEELL